MIRSHDREIIRTLAAEVAEVAALPVQQEKKRLWTKLNGLRPERPMVMIDQVCWNEMPVEDELTLRCEDMECRAYETRLRRTLYQWKHFPVDMVVEPVAYVPKAVQNTGLGIDVEQEIAVGDITNDVVSHAYVNQFQTDADLDKIKTPVVTHDEAETARRLEKAEELFGGLLRIESDGGTPYLSVWDPVSMWMSVEDALYAMIDRPEYVRELVRRIVAGYMRMLDQMEALALLPSWQPLIHCTGAYTDALPGPDDDPARPRTRDIWMFGLAQMLATVSPDMFQEFEITPNLPLFGRFGLVYYGCCDPLDGKMEQVRRIPNVRKISMSPWADEEKGAREIGGDYVFSRKPNPSLLAWDRFDEEETRRHLQTSVDICAAHGCPLELILKDLSTVRYDPPRLWRWAEIAMEIVGG
jgi:hypothetical protein